LSVGAHWLLLGGIERLIAYWAADEDPGEHLAQFELAGFRMLTRNEPGFTRRL